MAGPFPWSSLRARTRGVPPPPRRPDGGGHGPQPPDTGQAPPADAARPVPTNRRVRLVVEVLDDPDEVARATEALAAQPGWTVRPAEERDGVTPQTRCTVLVVDVAARGAKRTAVGSVREKAARLAEQRKIAMWVRRAWLHLPVRAPDVTVVHVHRTTPAGAGPLRSWLWRQWIAVGGADTHHTLLLPGPPDPDPEVDKRRARAELVGRDVIGAEPFDPATHDVRLSVGPRPAVHTSQRRLITHLLLTVAFVVAMAGCGMVLAAGASPWRFAVLLPAAALVWPVGRWTTSNEPRPWVFRLSVGLVLTGSIVFLGFLWHSRRPGGLSAQLVALLPALLVVFTVLGVWHAVAHSWFSRNVHWLLPVLVAPLPFVLPWAGSFLHSVYLEDGLGIPANSVHIAFYWHYAAALEPLATAAGLALVFVACTGWARYFDWQMGAGGLIPWSAPLLIAVFAVTLGSSTLDEVADAAERAARDTRSGQRPGSYYGLQGELVCVRPLEKGKALPVHGGPAPVGHPVLTFKPEGDTVWVWDPDPARGRDATRHAVRLRAEDIELLPARRGTCP
ncbi:hypothetical protein ACFQVC_02500 [Streptomyces monticola]|uniref:Uncharacterized protein n=1 Tax=Streptomyces monticola TaxID=2666263 RepID=A0ABW2JBN2_9ACTN